MIKYPNILITGGSGYFAEQFVRRTVHLDWIERICLLSRNEMRQAEKRIDLERRLMPGCPEKLRWFIGDVRDQDRLRRAMEGTDLVIHAAALKRIEVAEYNVLEAVATNVMGTSNTVNAAIDAGVKRLILLSTDKACNPTTTYGLTKALAENIVLKGNYYAEHRSVSSLRLQETTFAVCRYGNVIGSTGSVVPTWRTFKERGHRKVPITDPEATRFWMHADYAVALVTEAMREALPPGPGAMFLPPEMPAFRLADLAEAMELETTVVGMPAGEKVHEEMVPGRSSENAPRMSVNDIRTALEEIE